MAGVPIEESRNADAPVEVTLPDLARRVVADIAPDELDLLPEATTAWLAGDLQRPGERRWVGGSIRFGLDPSLISQIILPVLTGAVTEVLSTARESLWQRLMRRLRRHRPDPTVPPFTAEQAALIRTACVRNAIAAGVSNKRAELIADAVYGSLARALTSPTEG